MNRIHRRSFPLFLVLAIIIGSGLAAAGEIGTSTDADKGVITITKGDRELLKYQFTPSPYKVYVKQWSTPNGRQVLRDSPHDHVHHHALMYAIGADDVDFWVENPNGKPGSQLPRGQPAVTVSDADGAKRATISQAIDWTCADGKRRLFEKREITLDLDTIPGASLLQWQTRFTPAEGLDKAELWGRHYFGLGLRMVQSMDAVGTFINSAGETGVQVRGTEYVVPAAWCAYTAPVDGEPVTIAMFCHKDNVRHPTKWFTMTKHFAYLSATLNLWKEPMTLTANKPLDLRYGVVLWDGKIEKDVIQQAYDTFGGTNQ
jgi:hypothetical protein